MKLEFLNRRFEEEENVVTNTILIPWNISRNGNNMLFFHLSP